MHTTKPFMRNASLEEYYEFAIAIPVQWQGFEAHLMTKKWNIIACSSIMLWLFTIYMVMKWSYTKFGAFFMPSVAAETAIENSNKSLSVQG